MKLRLKPVAPPQAMPSWPRWKKSWLWLRRPSSPICPPSSSEVSLALTCEDRGEVDRLVEAGAAAGGKADINPPEDHGFMYQRMILDPDGHVWEPFWMDPAFAAGETPAGAEA